jgi:cytochrome c peroxidase
MRRDILSAAAVALLLAGGSARAQSGASLQELRWLDPATAVDALTSLPRRQLRAESGGGVASPRVALGELAFRSPRILGGEARAGGLACQTCHPNGGSNGAFFLAEVSDRSGNVDVTHRLFNRATDDSAANPVNIPSLRGVRLTAPYGRDGRTASLREFTRDVIVGEFAGAEPAGWLLDALAAYMRELDFLPGPDLTTGGRLDPSADAAARRGEALFWRPFPNQPELSCAGCHRPSAGFIDGLRHDIGSGGVYDTPSLLGSARSAPYFHDGRFAGLADVVEHFDTAFTLRLGTAEKRDLVAYLDAIGAERDPYEPARLGDDLAAVRRFLAVVDAAAADEDGAVGSFAAQSLRRELGSIHARLPQPEGRQLRDELLAMSQALNRLAGAFEAGTFIAARAALPELRSMLDRAWRLRETAAAGSLYDKRALRAALPKG